MYPEPSNHEPPAQRADESPTVSVTPGKVMTVPDVPPNARQATHDRTRQNRCLAALVADPRPCEGQTDVVRVIDQTGQGTPACLLHGAVLLASLNGGRVRPAQDGPSATTVVRGRARAMHPFDGVFVGPGVQPVTTLEEAAVFPSAPCPLPPEPRLRSSGLGNAPGRRWVPGQRYQASHAPGSAAENPGDGARGTGCKEVATR